MNNTMVAGERRLFGTHGVVEVLDAAFERGGTPHVMVKTSDGTALLPADIAPALLQPIRSRDDAEAALARVMSGPLSPSRGVLEDHRALRIASAKGTLLDRAEALASSYSHTAPGLVAMGPLAGSLEREVFAEISAALEIPVVALMQRVEHETWEHRMLWMEPPESQRPSAPIVLEGHRYLGAFVCGERMVAGSALEPRKQTIAPSGRTAAVVEVLPGTWHAFVGDSLLAVHASHLSLATQMSSATLVGELFSESGQIGFLDQSVREDSSHLDAYGFPLHPEGMILGRGFYGRTARRGTVSFRANPLGAAALLCVG